MASMASKVHTVVIQIFKLESLCLFVRTRKSLSIYISIVFPENAVFTAKRQV